MFIAPLILNSGRKLKLFLNAPHNQNLKYAILFKPNDEILSQQQKTLIQQWSRGWWRHHLDVTWEDILWQMLSCCGLTFFYV